MKFRYKTTKTNHKLCMDALANKCNWEHMSRLAVLWDWPNIVCEDCKKEMAIERITNETERKRQ